MAVLAGVSLAGYVNPVGAAVGGFLDEVVKVAVVLDPAEELVQNVLVGVVLAVGIGVAVRGNAQVGCLAKHVLGVGAAFHLGVGVELGTSVTGTDADGLAVPLAQGL